MNFDKIENSIDTLLICFFQENDTSRINKYYYYFFCEGKILNDTLYMFMEVFFHDTKKYCYRNKSLQIYRNLYNFDFKLIYKDISCHFTFPRMN